MNRGLLLGSGFSYDLGMPLASELSEVFFGIFDNKKIKILTSALLSQEPFGKDRPINKKAITSGLSLLSEHKNSNNYEAFLADIQKIKNISQPNQSDMDSYHYLFEFFYQIVHSILSLYQEISYEVIYPINKEWYGGLENFLSEEPTWVFSLNHDLYLENLAIDLNIPVTYGANGQLEFPIDNLDLNKVIKFELVKRKELNIENPMFLRKKRGINLVKLHGGLSERLYDDAQILCNLSLKKDSSQKLMNEFLSLNKMAYYHGDKKVPGGRDETITNPNGALDIFSKSMLTGGAKYSINSKDKEGEEKLKLFHGVLKNLDELTIIGYGFNDSHINFELNDALILNEKLTMRIVDPIFRNIPDYLQRFESNLRIKRAQCGASHWMSYYRDLKWNERQIEALKENNKLREIIKKRVIQKI